MELVIDDFSELRVIRSEKHAEGTQFYFLTSEPQDLYAVPAGKYEVTIFANSQNVEADRKTFSIGLVRGTMTFEEMPEPAPCIPASEAESNSQIVVSPSVDLPNNKALPTSRRKAKWLAALFVVCLIAGAITFAVWWHCFRTPALDFDQIRLNQISDPFPVVNGVLVLEGDSVLVTNNEFEYAGKSYKLVVSPNLKVDLF